MNYGSTVCLKWYDAATRRTAVIEDLKQVCSTRLLVDLENKCFSNHVSSSRCISPSVFIRWNPQLCLIARTTLQSKDKVNLQQHPLVSYFGKHRTRTRGSTAMTAKQPNQHCSKTKYMAHLECAYFEYRFLLFPLAFDGLNNRGGFLMHQFQLFYFSIISTIFSLSVHVLQQTPRSQWSALPWSDVAVVIFANGVNRAEQWSECLYIYIQMNWSGVATTWFCDKK